MAERGRARRLLLAATALGAVALLLLLLRPEEVGQPSTSAERTAATSSAEALGPAAMAAPDRGGATGQEVVGGVAAPIPVGSDDLLVVVTRGGAACAEPLELRRVGSPEVVELALDASGACRVQLRAGWWAIGACGPLEELTGEWTQEDPRLPRASAAVSLSFTSEPTQLLVFAWGEAPAAPELSDVAQVLGAASPGALLHVDRLREHVVEGVVVTGEGPGDGPIAGASVDLELDVGDAPRAQRLVTGPDGRVRFQVAPSTLARAVVARVVARASGRVTARWDLRFEAPESRPRPLVLAPGALAVTGRVVDLAGVPWSCRVRLRPVAAGTGEPLLGARVQVLSVRRVGDALEVDLHEPGRHGFHVVADGRVGRLLEVDVVAGQPVDLGDVALEQAGALEVAVRWPVAPIERLALGRDGEEQALSFDLAIASVDGPLSVEELAPGGATWRLTALRPDGGRYEATFGAEVVAGETTRVEVDLRVAHIIPRETHLGAGGAR